MKVELKAESFSHEVVGKKPDLKKTTKNSMRFLLLTPWREVRVHMRRHSWQVLAKQDAVLVGGTTLRVNTAADACYQSAKISTAGQ